MQFFKWSFIYAVIYYIRLISFISFVCLFHDDYDDEDYDDDYDGEDDYEYEYEDDYEYFDSSSNIRP